MDEKDVDEIAKYKYMCVASDGNSLRNNGPLSSGKPHQEAMEQTQDLLNNLFQIK